MAYLGTLKDTKGLQVVINKTSRKILPDDYREKYHWKKKKFEHLWKTEPKVREMIKEYGVKVEGTRVSVQEVKEKTK